MHFKGIFLIFLLLHWKGLFSEVWNEKSSFKVEFLNISNRAKFKTKNIWGMKTVVGSKRLFSVVQFGI